MMNEDMTANWLHLPRIPFEVIMTKVAHKSLADLQSCSEVCSVWSVMIEKDILKNPAVMDTIRDETERAFGPEARVDPWTNVSGTIMFPLLPNNELISNAKWLSDRNLINIEVIKSFAAGVRERLSLISLLIGMDYSDSPSLPTCAASLAYHELLGHAEEITCLGLANVDLTSVPTEHLTALASWVTFKCRVSIHKVSGIGLTSFLNNLKCESLLIDNQSLGREETQALVQAMESGVEMVELSMVTFEMETLVTYSGRGRCWNVRLYGDNDEDPEMWRVNIKEPYKIWAMSQDWEVIDDRGYQLVMKNELVIKRR